MPRRKGDAPIDWWTLPHIATGAVLGALLALHWVVLLLVAFEAVEAALRRYGRGGQGLFEHESVANIAMDIVVAAAAAVLVQWIMGGPLL